MSDGRILRTFARAALLFALIGSVALPERCAAAFGLTSGGGSYIVDTGAGLVFMVSQSTGDITSLVFNGVQYQATDKKSQIASGLGTPTAVTATLFGTNYIRITVTTASNNAVVSSLTQYLMARNEYNNIYMATYVTSEPAVGELRWITRLQFNEVPDGPVQSDNNGNTGAIESSDVFGYTNASSPKYLQSTSKYYGRQRAMELTYTGATNHNIGVWSVFDTRESSSGGPFYRDIENQGDGEGSDQEVYNYMNSGHEEPEAWRSNVLYGPYAMSFTTGGPPTLPIDYSWIETGGLNLTGWVSATNRGAVSGVASGIPAGFQGVVGFANANAQYWAVVSSNGTYLTPLMKPGAYTTILYKGELPVRTNSVTVIARATNIVNLASAEIVATNIFQIGQWDGTPADLLNGSNIVNMHPSDVRNANWGPVSYDTSVNAPGDFPSIQMREANSPTTVLFNLAANQLKTYTLRIGMTCAYNGGRPQVTINGHTLSAPGASSQPNSRSFTTGTYRGNEVIESYSIPSGDLVNGQNTLSITPISGSSDLGTWLSAGWVYDAVELDVPNTAPPTPGAPGNLAAALTGSAQINLSWNSNSTNEVNFLIERSANGVNFSLIAAVTQGITHFIDTNVSPGTTYFYRVRAANSGGNSAYSNAASAAPLLISSAVISGNNLVFSGSGGMPGSNYYVLASANPASGWARIATNQFDANGSFSVTNTVNPDAPQQFYLIQLP